MTIGSDLREAREQHGLTLGDISTRTKIRVPVLRAIESDDFAHVPGGVIARGFLKLYAREVGLDADDIARRFNALHAAAVDPNPARAPGDTRLTESAAPASSGARLSFPAVFVVAAIVALGGGYVVWSRMARPMTTPASAAVESAPPPAQASQSEATGDRTAAAAGAPPSTETPAVANVPAAGVLRVDIRATEASWLAATADGEQIAYRMLNPGEHVSLSVKSAAVLRIGIPTNVSVSVNDTPLKPFGRPGMPATLRITPDNYRTLLEP